MGSFWNTSHNLPSWYKMDGGVVYVCAHVIVCLFMRLREIACMCTDIFVFTGTLFKSVDGFLFFGFCIATTCKL